MLADGEKKTTLKKRYEKKVKNRHGFTTFLKLQYILLKWYFLRLTFEQNLSIPFYNIHNAVKMHICIVYFCVFIFALNKFSVKSVKINVLQTFLLLQYMYSVGKTRHKLDKLFLDRSLYGFSRWLS